MSTAIQSGFFSRQAVLCLCWGWMLVLPAIVWGQTNYYATNGTEYAIVGSLPGDQVYPDVAVTTQRRFYRLAGQHHRRQRLGGECDAA